MGPRNKTLRWSLVRRIICGWFLPLIALLFLLLVSAIRVVDTQTRRMLIASMNDAVQLCAFRLEDSIEASKTATYLPDLKNAYDEYKKGGPLSRLSSSVNLFLEQQYKFSPMFERAIFYFAQNPDRLYSAGNESVQSSVLPMDAFRAHVLPLVQEKGKDLDTGICFLSYDSHVYLVRNLVNRAFLPYATLVLELDCDYVFGSFESVFASVGRSVWYEGSRMEEMNAAFQPGTSESYSEKPRIERQQDRSYVVQALSVQDGKFLFAVPYDTAVFETERLGMVLLFVLVMAFLIPLIAMVLRFFRRRITYPVQQLSQAAQEIAKGNYGIRVSRLYPPGMKNPEDEIGALADSFDAMSSRLKDAFNRIYVEEIALRDANIHALQSQINPHFLNNTLEIINWQARLSGDEKSSRMIEALSTMMDATTNRDKRPLIPLREELTYVQAYLYIISCRYGSKFDYDEEIDGEALDFALPRLIIQPVIENAVEHGEDEEGYCRVAMKITMENNRHTLRIRILNQGVPSERDREKIHLLLSDSDTIPEQHAVSIGIHNVYRRLRILFGEDSGLSIDTDENGNTISTILVKNSQS